MTKSDEIERLNAHGTWVDNLSQHDRMNFLTLSTLPNALTVVEDMDSGEYKDRLIYQIALNKSLKESDNETIG